MVSGRISLFSEVKYYLKLRKEFLAYLSKNPDDWPKYQEIFNLTLDKLYKDIVLFEKENIVKSESEVYRRKKIFEKRYRRYFLHGEFIKRSFEKPCGYSGDFKIIDSIYSNDSHTNGFERLWDNYFQQLAVTEAIRERKEDFKKIILKFVKNRIGSKIRIMDLASGPVREIKELLESESAGLFKNVIFDCYDFDEGAIEYGQKLLNNYEKVNFYQKNAVRLALKKKIEDEISSKYDMIYSTGLFDYLDDRVSIRLVGNLRKLLSDDGVMIIANAADKYNNISAGWMEWVAEWYLIYRTEKEFREIFLCAGFPSANLQIIPQKSKIMQYCLAGKTEELFNNI